MLRFFKLSFLLLLFAMASCTKAPDKVVSISPTSFSVEDQITIGAAFKNTISSHSNEFTILSKNEYSEAYSYVSTLLNTLLFTSQVSRRSDFDWTLSILHDDEIKTAFFLPGGHFYITTGLLRFIDTESELLSIIGHELFYVETDAMVLAMKDEFGSKTLGDILLGNPIEDMKGMAEDMPKLVLSEDEVLEADEYIIDMICPFQYDAYSLKTLIIKALQGAANERPLWLSSRYSNTEQRLEQIAMYAEHCGEEGITNEEDYLKFKENHLP